jgi:hypothetical protein
MGGTRSSGGAGIGTRSASVPEERYETVSVLVPPYSRPTPHLLLSRYGDRVEEIVDESPDGFFVNLKRGWLVDIGGAGSGGFDTLREVEDALRRSVRRIS